MNTESDVGWKLNYIEKVLSCEQPALSIGKNEWVAAIPGRHLSSSATTGGWGELNLGQGLDVGFAIGDAIAELRTAIELLSSGVLLMDPAMVAYRATLKVAVSAYEKAEAESRPIGNRISSLSVALSMARGVLNEEVTTLSAWTAVQGCVRPGVNSFPVPNRFLKKLDGFVSIPAPSDAELQSIVDVSAIS